MHDRRIVDKAFDNCFKILSQATNLRHTSGQDSSLLMVLLEQQYKEVLLQMKGELLEANVQGADTVIKALDKGVKDSVKKSFLKKYPQYRR